MTTKTSRAGSAETPPMLRDATDGPATWTADRLDDDAGLVPITDACLDELLAVARVLDANPLPVISLHPDDFDLAACGDMMRQVKETLDGGIGFAVIDRLPIEDLGPERTTALNWLLANMVGTTVAQKWDGTMLYDVRDTGKVPSPGNGVRSSLSNRHQELHTDNSYNLPPDYVALLCLHPAKTGGVSGIVSFQTAHNRLLETRPDLLERLYRPFCFDRQSEHAPDDPNTVNRVPVFAYDGDRLRTRYAISLVHGGHEIAGEPLDDAGREAIAVLDSIIEEPTMRRDFNFQAGQIQIVDNRRIGHRRTGFDDWPEPDRKRHLVRLWIRNQGRPFYAG